MKVFIYLFVGLYALFLISCNKRVDNHHFETIAIDIEAAKAIDIRNNTQCEITEIELELTDNSLLTEIEQIEIINNKIYVYDKHRLLVFNTQGNFLHSIGKRGSGPGEYTSVDSFFLKKVI